MNIKGVIFDLDGVITDTAEFHYRAWQDLGEKIGITFDRAFNENLKGISRMDSLNLILEHGNKVDDYSDAEKEALATDKNNDYKTLIEEITPADILPGIQTFLDACIAKGMKLALASASKNGPAILDRLELTHYFEAIVDPASLKNGKPDPEIFLKAAELLHLEPSECVGVEDAEAGIKSINAAGMFSVGVGSPESMKEADFFVENTQELDLEKVINKYEENR